MGSEHGPGAVAFAVHARVRRAIAFSSQAQSLSPRMALDTDERIGRDIAGNALTNGVLAARDVVSCVLGERNELSQIQSGTTGGHAHGSGS